MVSVIDEFLSDMNLGRKFAKGKKNPESSIREQKVEFHVFSIPKNYAYA